MIKKNFTIVVLNFAFLSVLVALFAAPIYFASKFTQVAGVKSESTYLVISQAEKFPGMKFSQDGTTYTLNLPNSAEAYLAVLVLNNPTENSRTYKIESTGKVFFGENLEDQINSVSLPKGISIPISVLSQDNNEVKFSIN